MTRLGGVRELNSRQQIHILWCYRYTNASVTRGLKFSPV